MKKKRPVIALEKHDEDSGEDQSSICLQELVDDSCRGESSACNGKPLSQAQINFASEIFSVGRSTLMRLGTESKKGKRRCGRYFMDPDALCEKVAKTR